MLVNSLVKNIIVFSGDNLSDNIASVAISIVLNIFYAHHHLYAFCDFILFHVQRMILDHLGVDVCYALFSAFKEQICNFRIDHRLRLLVAGLDHLLRSLIIALAVRLRWGGCGQIFCDDHVF
jgi:hypothetical protein